MIKTIDMDVTPVAINSLRRFRESVYGLFSYARDAAMNLVDALSSFNAQSVIELSLSPEFTRSHDSISRAIRDYRGGRKGLEEAAVGEASIDVTDNAIAELRKHLPDDDSSNHQFALDVSACPRPYSKTLSEKQIIHYNNPTPGQKPIAVGHNLSCLGLVTNSHKWCLPLSLKRVPIGESQVCFGLHQAEDVARHFSGKPCIFAADAKYSNKEAIRRAHRWSNAILLTRLSPTRVFYYQHDATNDSPSKRGRKKYYGKAFKLRDHSDTVSGTDKPSNEEGSTLACIEPNATTTIAHTTSKGKQWRVTIDRFDDLIMKGTKCCSMKEAPVSIFRITTMDEEGNKVYKQPLWLVGAGKIVKTIGLGEIFSAYNLRFNIEHWFRFAKRHLLLDKFQTPDCSAEEDWLLFPVLATHLLFQSQDLATDYARPWEPKQPVEQLSPSQVKRAMGKILREVGTPASEPKIRGIGIGRDSNNRVRRDDSAIHIKTKSQPVAGSIVIKLPVDSLDSLSDAKFSAHNLPVSGSALKDFLKQSVMKGADALNVAQIVKSKQIQRGLTPT